MGGSKSSEICLRIYKLFMYTVKGLIGLTPIRHIHQQGSVAVHIYINIRNMKYDLRLSHRLKVILGSFWHAIFLFTNLY